MKERQENISMLRLRGLIVMAALAVAAAAGGPAAWCQEKSAGKDQAGGKADAEAKGSGAAAKSKPDESDGKRVTGADGKTYILRQTPFGTVKVEESAAKSQPGGSDENEPPPDMKAREAGDSIHFERTTPFGVVKWSRKKTELTETERRAWERERLKSSPAPASEKKEKE